jgi:hypothetical protein
MNDIRTPSEINGFPVVAMVRVPDRNGYLPDMHVVVCASPSIARETTYIVWTCAWQQVGETPSAGHWEVTSSGRYDIRDMERALLLMCAKASDAWNA